MNFSFFQNTVNSAIMPSYDINHLYFSNYETNTLWQTSTEGIKTEKWSSMSSTSYDINFQFYPQSTHCLSSLFHSVL